MDYTDKPVMSSQPLLPDSASYNTQLKSISGSGLPCYRYRSLLFCTAPFWRCGEALITGNSATSVRPVTAFGVGPDFVIEKIGQEHS